MKSAQFDHIEEKLIKVVDRIADKHNATAAEVEALASIAFALARINEQD